MEGFHGNGGLTFERTEIGVRIRWYVNSNGERLVKSTEFDLNTWASAVASCTFEGENAETFLRSRNLWLYGNCATPTDI